MKVDSKFGGKFGGSVGLSKLVFSYVVVIPTFAALVLFSLGPIIYSFYVSFHIVKPWAIVFIGLESYLAAFRDPLVIKSFVNTFYFVGMRIFFGTSYALLVALGLNKLIKARGLILAGYFSPIVISMVAFSLLFLYFYNPTNGVFNLVLGTLHLPTFEYIYDPKQAMPSLVFLTIWKYGGLQIIILLAGIKGLPVAYYEAAAIDGANCWQMFWRITLPLLKPVMLFVVIMQFIQCMLVFTPMYLLTEGGPLQSTYSVTLDIYVEAFENFRLGYATAIAIMLLAVVFIITILQLRLGKTAWEY